MHTHSKRTIAKWNGMNRTTENRYSTSPIAVAHDIVHFYHSKSISQRVFGVLCVHLLANGFIFSIEREPLAKSIRIKITLHFFSVSPLASALCLDIYHLWMSLLLLFGCFCLCHPVGCFHFCHRCVFAGVANFFFSLLAWRLFLYWFLLKLEYMRIVRQTREIYTKLI